MIGGAVFGIATLMQRRKQNDASGAAEAMKAQRSLGLALSWPRVTAVFLGRRIVILVLASHCPDSWQGNHRSRGGWASASR